MADRPLYVQICTALLASLLALALFVQLFEWRWGIGDHEHDLFATRVSSVMEVLLPPADASPEIHQTMVDELAVRLDVLIAVWDAEGTLLATSGDPPPMPMTGIERGTWVSEGDRTRWITRLRDDRLVVVEAPDLFVEDEDWIHAVTLFLLAGFIALAMYPYVREMTFRLERLQAEVERIGSGDLGARVEVEGNDEIGRLAASFNNAASRIETMVTAQRLLLANASHEFRTPLTRIRLSVDRWALGKGPQKDVIQQDIRELDELIDELILIARLDTTMTAAVIESFESVDLLGLAAEECSRFPEVAISGGGGSDVLGDRRMLQHLVRNLVENGIKHGKPPVQVSVRQIDRVVELVVSDGGSGVPLDEREKVVQPFYRAKGRQDVPGSGLGLALVERIANAHTARLSFESNPSAVTVAFHLLDQ